MPGEEEMPQDMAWGVHAAAGGAARCRVYVGLLPTKKGWRGEGVPWGRRQKGRPYEVVGGGMDRGQNEPTWTRKTLDKHTKRLSKRGAWPCAWPACAKANDRRQDDRCSLPGQPHQHSPSLFHDLGQLVLDHTHHVLTPKHAHYNDRCLDQAGLSLSGFGKASFGQQ